LTIQGWNDDDSYQHSCLVRIWVVALPWAIMTHGTEDYWSASPTSTTYASVDIAELAARLKSPDTYDRRGNVLNIEDWNNGLSHVYGVSAGGSGTTQLSAVGSVNSPLTAKITTDLINGNYYGVKKEMFYPAISKIGLELCFSINNTIHNAFVYLDFYDGTNLTEFVIYYEHSSGKLYIRDSAGVYHVLATPGVLYPDNKKFEICKLVVDLLSGAYVRLLWGAHNYDASAYSGKVTAAASNRYMYYVFQVDGTAGGAGVIQLGSIIVTQNET
jgi:hypothetical protein